MVTHPGGAHKDDFLACSLLVSTYGVDLRRKEPSESEVADPQVIVVDVGGEHAPERMNFDHHQFAVDREPTCALSLVLAHLGLYEDACLYCDWLETSEWLDTRGAVRTAAWLGVERDLLAKLNSPVDITLLRRFARSEIHQKGEPIYEVMRMIGEDMVSFLKGMRERIAEIEVKSEVWWLNDQCRVLYMPRDSDALSEPSSGMARYIDQKELGCVAMVYADRRGSGYALTRYNDDLRLDFNRVVEEPDVTFAHKAGFVAKTTSTDEQRLKQLLLQAWKG